MSDEPELFDEYEKPSLPATRDQARTRASGKKKGSVPFPGADAWSRGYNTGAQEFAGLLVHKLDAQISSLPPFEAGPLAELREEIVRECARRWPDFDVEDQSRRHDPVFADSRHEDR